MRTGIAPVSRVRQFARVSALPLLAALLCVPALALDVTRPARVQGLLADRGVSDVQLSWSPVTLDAAGNAETIAGYNIYRGTTPDFVPDRVGGSNRIGSPTGESFIDAGAAADGNSYFYLISAVDTAGNESDTKTSQLTSLPLLSGFWTNTTIEVDWTGAQPSGDVFEYRVYYGRASREYEFVQSVGLSTTHTLTGLQGFVNWYVAVTAVDSNGNETPFSNEHIDAVNGTVFFRVHDAEELCWGASDCTPTDPEKIQRANGWQLMVPTQFPEGDWVAATVTLTMDSRLCDPPGQGTTSRCGDGNPCVSPPCNGGWNPCGDPWDRRVHVFTVLDDCIEAGGSCITQNNLELMRAITPYGTDAPPPDGNGRVAARKLTMDITPYVPLLTGQKYIGVEIGHFTQKGHWVTVDFEFTERPELASPKPPADGIEIIGFGGAPLAGRQVTLPPEASDVKMRVFTTAHGTDEFSTKTNQIRVDGTPIWQVNPWRSDCNNGPGPCINWNSCETSTCWASRAGWCPGYVACHENAPCDNDIGVTSDLSGGGTYDVDYNVVGITGSWSVSAVLYWYE